ISTRHGCSEGTIMYLVAQWAFQIFLTVADRELLHLLTLFPPTLISITVVMILRVYAMWNRSKWILWVLLFIHVSQVIVSSLFAGIYYNPNTYISVTVDRFLDFSFCNISWNNVPALLNMYSEIPRFILGALLLLLAVIQTLQQSVEMYKATKQWQPNRYMQLLVRDGIIYFLVYASLSP
ncbi:hypothetical protein J3R83DRAFT_8579, partial [Lanmaoa asiatica]